MTIMSKIKIDSSFYMFGFLYFYSGYFYEFLIYFLILIIHDTGHILVSKLLKIRVHLIKIYPFGGIIEFNKKILIGNKEELLIACSGVLFQIIFEIINIFFLKNEHISLINKYIIMTNILPISPLDGGKIFFVLLKYFTNFANALYLKNIFNFVFIFILFIKQLIFQNINYFLIFFLLIMSFKEYKSKKKLFIKYNIEKTIKLFS